MKQSKIISIFKTLETLADNEHLSKENQWDLYRLRRFLRPHFEFQQEREDTLRKKYMEFANEEGLLPKDKTQEFINELNEIGNLEVELEEYQKIKIPIKEGMSFKIMEPLEDFIEFTPE